PLGTVYHRGVSAADVASKPSQDNLQYHGGAVLPKSTPHAVFWEPSGFSFPSGYETTIEQYFHDVATDSGGTDNVYGVAKQYFDVRKDGTRNHHANYEVVDGGAIIDTNPYPPSACPVPSGYTNCIADSQIRQE